MTLDVVKAAQIMRESGLEVAAGESWATGSRLSGRDTIDVRAPGCVVAGDSLTGGYVGRWRRRSADEMDALAARLVWTAALCRRIDAECRGAPAPEPQAARDVTVTWAPGPGAALGPRRRETQ